MIDMPKQQYLSRDNKGWKLRRRVPDKLQKLAGKTQWVEGLEEKGVGLRILDFAGTDVDTKSPAGEMMVTMFGAMAQFEREMMLERQREGIAKAKAEGKYKGRDPVPKHKVEQALAMKAQGIKVIEIAKQLSLGRSTVYRVLKEQVS